MFCKNCGKHNNANDMFCEHCGSKLKDFVDTPYNTYTPEYHKTDRLSGMNPAAIVIIVLLSIIIIIGIVFLIFALKDTSVSTTSVVDDQQSTEVIVGDEGENINGDYDFEVSEVKKVSISMDEVNSVISSHTSTNNVAVSIIDYNKDKKYSTYNDSSLFVASGFYAPLYLAAMETGSSVLMNKANTMMTSMDNSAANYIIDVLGGFTGINITMRNNNFNNTSFSRNFGDTKASAAGYENYTSADDAIEIINYLYYNGGYTTMKVNLVNEGIYIPSGATVYAHRGQGIGTSYNVFAVVKTRNVDYAIVMLTENMGNTTAKVKSAATSLFSDIFANVNSQMESIYND